MKSETDPILAEEWLLRLVWRDRVTGRTPIISPNSFEPRKNESTGISLFRRDCLNDPVEALLVIAEEKRPSYAIVQLLVSRFISLKFSVKPNPIDVIPGHVVVPEINIIAYWVNKDYFKPIFLQLAEMASENIIRRPLKSN